MPGGHGLRDGVGIQGWAGGEGRGVGASESAGGGESDSCADRSPWGSRWQMDFAVSSFMPLHFYVCFELNWIVLITIQMPSVCDRVLGV